MVVTDSELALVIPYEMRWKLVSELVASIPAMYDNLFSDIVGKEYTEIAGAVSIEVARRARLIALNLGLLFGDGPDLAHTLSLILTIFYGPNYRLEELPISEESAVLLCTRCPRLTETQLVHSDTQNLFHRCLGFIVYTVEGLNPEYTVRFVRASCTGDRHCEIKVQKKSDKKDVSIK